MTFRARIGLILLVCMAGLNQLHLPALQVAAWTGMLISYSRDASLGEAAEMTFDGEHPCPMCTAIKKQQTAQQDALSGWTHLERLLMFVEHTTPWQPSTALLRWLADTNAEHPALANRPRVPPPRTAAA